MSTIYDRIRARRRELGLTVEDLAQQLGYKDKSSISKIENGKADIPQAKVELFANALHTTTAYLMGVDGPALPPGCEPLPRLKRLPLVGRIACGMPILAEQNIEGEVAVREEWPADFILTAWPRRSWTATWWPCAASPRWRTGRSRWCALVTRPR